MAIKIKQHSKYDIEDTVDVYAKKIKDIPVPVNGYHYGLIPEALRSQSGLLVNSNKKKFQLPRKLALYLRNNYPDNFSNSYK